MRFVFLAGLLILPFLSGCSKNIIETSTCFNFPAYSSPNGVGFGYNYTKATQNWVGGVFNPNDNNQILYGSSTGTYITKLDNKRDTFLLLRDPLGAGPWCKTGWILAGDLAGNIYKIKSNGDSLTQLNTFTTNNFYADWSPDGKKIVFTGEDGPHYGGLFIMNADGTGERTLDSLHGSVSRWSPDGTKIAFRVDAYIAYLDTTSRQVHVFKNNPPGEVINSIVWFHDSKWLAYSSNLGLFKINTETGQVILLRTCCESRGYVMGHISNDDQTMLVTRADATLVNPSTINSSYHVYSMSANGSNETEIKLY